MRKYFFFERVVSNGVEAIRVLVIHDDNN